MSAILTETGLDPRCLEFELTETFLMEASGSTAAVLQALKDMGLQIALDDFGTGYSSLSFLRRFPIDTVKIDRSFVRDMTTDADDASIVTRRDWHGGKSAYPGRGGRCRDARTACFPSGGIAAPRGKGSTSAGRLLPRNSPNCWGAVLRNRACPLDSYAL